jgi:pseudouridine-5'-phosphate glycosidase
MSSDPPTLRPPATSDPPTLRPPATSDTRVAEEVATAVRDGRPVVALESTLIAHGLPSPRNVDVAARIEQTVREHGAVPATIGMIAGTVVVGLSPDEVRLLGTTPGVAKLSVRDLAVAAATGAHGATTVASTAVLAARAGIGVFATGGLGGVHRGASESFDESADLTALSHTAIVIVCAGVKSILDVPATLERLETLGVTVLGYGSKKFAGFYLADSGAEVDWVIESPAQVASTMRARDALGLPPAAIVVSNPLPDEVQLDPALHDTVLAEGLGALERKAITGKAVTPYLLAHFHEATQGASLEVNVEVVLRNAALAARIATAYASA